MGKKINLAGFDLIQLKEKKTESIGFWISTFASLFEGGADVKTSLTTLASNLDYSVLLFWSYKINQVIKWAARCQMFHMKNH